MPLPLRLTVADSEAEQELLCGKERRNALESIVRHPHLFAGGRPDQAADFDGTVPPGSYIPSVRELAQEAAVNPNTMQKALALLESQGLLITHRTTGRRVTESAELIRCLRLDMAHSHIETCKQNLKALGFSEEEIQTMMSASEKE